jgi:signal transduction histidine kinase
MNNSEDSGHGPGADHAELRDTINRLEAELLLAQKGTQAFVSMLAHELRTPLGAILMWAHVLRMGRAEDRDAALDAIEASAQEQSAMIAGLLDLTRALAGTLRLDIGDVDVARTVLVVLEEARSLASTAQVTLKLSIAEGTFALRGDAVRLRALMGALLKDAVKVTPPAGEVQVSLGRSEGAIRLTVSDTGPSPSPGELVDLFTPFKPAGPRDRRQANDLRVALPLAQHVARLHHGRLLARKREVGQGRELVLDLPTAS